MKEGCVKDKESQPTLDADGSFETNNLDKSLMSVKREQPLTYMLEDVIARAMKVRQKNLEYGATMSSIDFDNNLDGGFSTILPTNFNNSIERKVEPIDELPDDYIQKDLKSTGNILENTDLEL